MASSKIELNEVKFENVELTNVKMTHSNFTNITFINCTFRHVNFSNSSFNNISMVDCDLDEVDFTQSEFDGIQFISSNFKQALFNKSNFIFTKYEDCQLIEVEFIRIKHKELSLTKCLLSKNNFLYTRLDGLNFSNLKLSDLLFSMDLISGMTITKEQAMAFFEELGVNVVVANYSEDWAKEFEKIKTDILKKISADIIRIEHVGSTSVEGLCAKPIIDIDIVIEDYSKFEAVKSGLASLGYEYEGDLGITEREAFSYEIDQKNQFMEHHIYVCPKHSVELNRHVTFRDHLRNNQPDCQKYGEIKRAAAKKFPTDIEGYLDMKGVVISEIYQRCGLLK
uniref:Dephospho-CoA kinase-like protein n=3 Tax=Latilactobacillus TaxID=2767885 RepID=A0A2H1MYF0_LATSK|nr:GrpB family protein [Latilactobacillus sakei]SOE45458.1 Putative dephospho-CoA kinase-like protein [Latilactobacillus sakei]